MSASTCSTRCHRHKLAVSTSLADVLGVGSCIAWVQTCTPTSQQSWPAERTATAVVGARMNAGCPTTTRTWMCLTILRQDDQFSPAFKAVLCRLCFLARGLSAQVRWAGFPRSYLSSRSRHLTHCGFSKLAGMTGDGWRHACGDFWHSRLCVTYPGWHFGRRFRLNDCHEAI